MQKNIKKAFTFNLNHENQQLNVWNAVPDDFASGGSG